MNAEVKSAVARLESTEVEAGPGTFMGILSTGALDRDGEKILPHAFSPLPRKIAIDVDHARTVASTVGSGEPYYDGAGTLLIKGTFASTDLAQETRALVREGHVAHFSVAFHNAKREKRDGVTLITKASLLNATITPIPSNVEARILSAKTSSSDDDLWFRAQRIKQIAEDMDRDADLKLRARALQIQVRSLTREVSTPQGYTNLKRVLRQMGDMRTVRALEESERRQRGRSR